MHLGGCASSHIGRALATINGEDVGESPRPLGVGDILCVGGGCRFGLTPYVEEGDLPIEDLSSNVLEANDIAVSLEEGCVGANIVLSVRTVTRVTSWRFPDIHIVLTRTQISSIHEVTRSEDLSLCEHLRSDKVNLDGWICCPWM